ncbi:MAG TPA: hypothetical protein VJ603_09185 [Paucimonas sp.]|nr:hypothetical protein [Paucimonas sp.]HJW54881.1 hypothetical protein [Burkholderiaceae bacterium]
MNDVVFDVIGVRHVRLRADKEDEIAKGGAYRFDIADPAAMPTHRQGGWFRQSEGRYSTPNALLQAISG